MAQKNADAVALLGGKHQAARRGEIERAGVDWKLTYDGREGATLEGFGERPERILNMGDAQMDEMFRLDAALGEAGRIRRAAFPSGEIVLDVEDLATTRGGTGGDGEREAGGGAEIAGGGRHDLMHRFAIQTAAESGVGSLDTERDRRPRRFAAVTDAAMLYGGNGLP